ncbi:class I SAM-dependent methyltransferase [Bradyrhizobium sp. CB82]|uniref:class I SAM-dependent methyltransferase n=1 Tax=Bradyrhizobium sp. CB82 TaxID=3039159 RepID=UPI0024B13436|nr:class I SAM-dependent methyltransferase [Bradyrhizobium sp. CB82]WFU45185.1 class I SAM-dependent methyltransferase [Bradyrhizobium sp. CB82]
MFFDHPDGRIQISELNNGKRRIHVHPRDSSIYIHRSSCDTAYPMELIAQILEVKGPGYLCDEISRDEDSSYLEAHLRATLFAHLPKSAFVGARLLDFGCGSGASTMIMTRSLPALSDVVGVELEDRFLRIARARADFYRMTNVRFERSPAGDRLPEHLGLFDFIVLPAVYEHLLPPERKTIIPQLWNHLSNGGVLFIDETPARWFPVETHTSSLPFVNYLPDPLAHRFVQYFSPRGLRNESWTDLLRKGIRGGSVNEILGIIHRKGGLPELLKPGYDGMLTPVDVWYEGYARSASGRTGELKRTFGKALKVFNDALHLAPVPYLSLAIRKNG